MNLGQKILPSSFRDPSGHVFEKEGIYYRQINDCYKPHYDRLMESGLYEKLTSSGDLITHEEIGSRAEESIYKVIKPLQIPFISYPYEWCFSALQDAALLTLRLQKTALDYGMCLKDATAFNVQWYQGRPIWIDTLSFDIYQEGEPWIAYRQFCQHFLAPLALASYQDARLTKLAVDFSDGIPLDLANRLLPGRSFLNLGIFLHLHCHAAAQKRGAESEIKTEKNNFLKMRKSALYGLIDQLENTICKLKPRKKDSHWGRYYQTMNYSSDSFGQKESAVKKFLEEVRPKTVWDLGANTGFFSRIAADLGIYTLSFDQDETAVEMNYQRAKKNKEKNILPLVVDLTSPSPASGWAHEERFSLAGRTPPDMLMALALIHHLAIGDNVPLSRIADYFSRLARYLIIEFIPKEDAQVQRLLRNRVDIFSAYERQIFEGVFSNYYKILRKKEISETSRVLYLMQRVENSAAE